MGEANFRNTDSEGREMWMYARSNGVILDVKFNSKGKVQQVKAREGNKGGKSGKGSTAKKSQRKNVGGIPGGTMKTGTPL